MRSRALRGTSMAVRARAGFVLSIAALFPGVAWCVTKGPGQITTGAGELAAGHGEIAVGYMHGSVESHVGHVALVSGQIGLSDRWALDVLAGIPVNDDARAATGIGLRALMDRTGRFRTAAYASWWNVPYELGARYSFFVTGVGLQWDVGPLTFDASAPVVLHASELDRGTPDPDALADQGGFFDLPGTAPFPIALVAGEAGATWRLGENHRIRAGIVSTYLASLVYRWEQSRWFAEAGLYSTGPALSWGVRF